MNAEPNKSKSLEYTLGIIILIGSIAVIVLLLPMFMSPRGRGNYLTESISNAKIIGLALFEFEHDFGAYPNNETAKDVTDVFPDHGHDLSGNSSNALFRQLLATGIVQSEEIFHAEIPGVVRPDGNIAPGEAMKKGEVGFAYISGLSTAGNPSTPLVLTPLIPGTTKFDPKPFKGKAIILHIDSSVRTYDIYEDGHIYYNGINILSQKHPIWNGKVPDIRYPDL